MDRLNKLHEFCTKLEHYPSRFAIQGEIERLMKDAPRHEQLTAIDIQKAMDPTGELSQFIGPGWIKEIMGRMGPLIERIK